MKPNSDQNAKQPEENPTLSLPSVELNLNVVNPSVFDHLKQLNTFPSLLFPDPTQHHQLIDKKELFEQLRSTSPEIGLGHTLLDPWHSFFANRPDVHDLLKKSTVHGDNFTMDIPPEEQNAFDALQKILQP